MDQTKAPRLSFDNLHEVSAYSHLVHRAEDLLSLARTCRAFKDDLARMPHVWRRLRNEYFEPPPPVCPTFLSEIQYTALVMESVCMACGMQAARLSGVVWTLRARYCEQCLVNRKQSLKLWDQWARQRCEVEEENIRQRVTRPSSMKDLIAATPGLVRWMEDIRLVKKRLGILPRYTEFLELLDKEMERMRSKAPLGSALPHTVDVAMLPETKRLAETVVPDTPNHLCGNKVSGNRERKRLSKTLTAQLPTLLDYWREERRRQLTGLITSLMVPVRRLPQDPLNLALAVFRCRECSTALRWPVILSHPHLYACDNASQGSVRHLQAWHTVICGLSITDDVFDSAIKGRFRSSSQWTLSRLEFRGEEICRIISACGGDPATADVDELDRIDARLACSLCSESNQRVLAMGWRAAISHMFESSQLATHTTGEGGLVFWTRVDSRLDHILKTVAAAQSSATRASSTANPVRDGASSCVTMLDDPIDHGFPLSQSDTHIVPVRIHFSDLLVPGPFPGLSTTEQTSALLYIPATLPVRLWPCDGLAQLYTHFLFHGLMPPAVLLVELHP
ncbi:hypothetical protein FOMPIDRAFT_1020736 [Fomitopsis schrenkii]|uniref:F-box domain-containing protein n=1 Tax=Fomitopsis schrenkii TaxID=2126942 RepID=S8DP88_FOMSC|nr:hypothetical protein FOMPIDRAFT_1020736 [Fomitopsis schrenkii]